MAEMQEKNDVATERLSFGKKVKSAIFWRSGSQIVAQVMMWGSTLAVIRILDPSDYGLFAMTQVVMAFLAFLNGYTFASALIQQEHVEPVRIRQAFGMLLLLNTGIALIQLASADLIAAYYQQPMVADLLRWQSLIYLATPFMVVPEVLMSRELDFRRQAYVNLTSALIGAATALGCALAGLGVWTLVAAPIAMFWSRAVGLCLVARFWVWPSFNFRGASGLFTFGSALLASHFLWIIQSQSDIFIAGRMLDPHNLGLYAEALFLTQIFASKFVPPLNEVAFPAYARIQNDKSALSWSFLKAVRLILLICCPLYLGMAVTAEPMVLTLFGEKWAGMIPFVQILALAMPFVTLQILFAPAVNALGRPGITVRCSAFGAVMMPATYMIAVQYGAIGLALGWLVAFPALTLFTYLQCRNVIGIAHKDMVNALWPGLSASVAMAAIVYLADIGIAQNTAEMAIPVFVQLALFVAVGGLAYLVMLRMLAPKTLNEIFRLVVKRQPVVATKDVAPA